MEIIRCLRCPCKCLQPAFIKEIELDELRYKIHRQNRRRAALQRLQERQEEMRQEREREEERIREKAFLHQQFRRLYRAERASQSTDDGETTYYGSRASIRRYLDTPSASEFLNSQSSPEGALGSPSPCKETTCLQRQDFGERDSIIAEKEFITAVQQGRDIRASSRLKNISSLPCVQEELTDDSSKPERPHSLLSQLSVSRAKLAQNMGDCDCLPEKGPGQRFSLMSYGDWLKDGQNKSSYVQTAARAAYVRKSRSEPRLPQASGRQRYRRREDKSQASQAQRQHSNEDKNIPTTHDSRTSILRRKKDDRDERPSFRKNDKGRPEKRLENSAHSQDDSRQPRPNSSTRSRISNVNQTTIEATRHKRNRRLKPRPTKRRQRSTQPSTSSTQASGPSFTEGTVYVDRHEL